MIINKKINPGEIVKIDSKYHYSLPLIV